jgi:uncharacterized protein (TIGR03083 family)
MDSATRTRKADYQQMARRELEDMSALLHTLDDSQWDAPSLCEGWKVRHVIGHICLGSTTSPFKLPVLIAPYRFNVARASSEESFKYGEEHSPADMLSTFDRVLLTRDRPGLGKVAAPREWFVDKLIHNQDIRRPLGLPRRIPDEHLVTAMDVLPGIGSFLQSKRHTKGLRFTATDLGHSVGDGPEVRGTAEALVLAMSGRPATLDELEGDGLEALRTRIAH